MKATSAPKFIVGYSGGLDSTVLLHLCAVFFGPEAVLAVHVNHGLQLASKQFEAHALRTCKAWDIRLQVERLKGLPAKGESVEAWARSERYRVFSELALRHDIAHVFTAHHQDDQIETLLIALSRGSGLEGLQGIAAHRSLSEPSNLPDIVLHRPLLSCSRTSLRAYAEEHDLRWIEDPSNQDPRFLRNRIRLELIPALQSALPDFARQASRSMRHLREATELQATQSQDTSLRGFKNINLTEAKISCKVLQAMDEASQATSLRAWLRAQGLKGPSQAKLSEIRKQLLRTSGASVCIALDGQTLRRQRDLIWLESEPTGSSPVRPPKSSDQVTFSAIKASAIKPEKTPQGWIWHLPEFKGSLLIKARNARKKEGLPQAEASQSDQECTISHLQVTPPKSAQKMQLEPNAPRKTLKNLFQAAGIPAELRKRLPCVMRGEEVLYVGGLGSAAHSPWKFEFLPDL